MSKPALPAAAAGFSASPLGEALEARDAQAARIRKTLCDHLGEQVRILDLLSTTGTSFAFRAHDSAHDRAVELRAIELGTAAASELVITARDCHTAGRLRHPHIAEVLRFGTVESIAYYAIDHHGGETLAAALDGGNRMPLDRVYAIVADVAAALDLAHAQGTLHTELSPVSITLTAAGAVINDLCLASAAQLTHRGRDRIAALAPYLAPEQWQGGGKVTAKADQYALAAIAYEMLVGRRPIEGYVAGGVPTFEPLALAPNIPLRPDVPLSVNAALLRALDKDPGRRFATVSAYAESLRPGNAATPRGLPTVHVEAELPPSRSLLVPAIVASIVLAAGAGLAYGPTRPYMLDAWAGVRGLTLGGARPQRSPVGSSDRDYFPRGSGGGASRTGPATASVGARVVPGATRSAARSPTSASSVGYVNVSSERGTGRVIVDGQFRGFTPFVGALGAGSHTIEVRALVGTSSFGTRRVSLAGGSTVAVQF